MRVKVKVSVYVSDLVRDGLHAGFLNAVCRSAGGHFTKRARYAGAQKHWWSRSKWCHSPGNRTRLTQKTRFHSESTRNSGVATNTGGRINRYYFWSFIIIVSLFLWYEKGHQMIKHKNGGEGNWVDRSCKVLNSPKHFLKGQFLKYKKNANTQMVWSQRCWVNRAGHVNLLLKILSCNVPM